MNYTDLWDWVYIPLIVVGILLALYGLIGAVRWLTGW